jgi:hypothetical protein
MNLKTLWAIIGCAGLIVLMGTCVSAPACETTWFTGEGAAPMKGDDRDKARDAAIKAAGLAAIGQSLAHITLEDLLAQFHLNDGLTSVIPFARIETVEIAEEGTAEAGGQGAAAQGPFISVKIKAAVCKIHNDPEANLRLSVALDQPVYTDGDEMRLTIRASHDCSYAVYIITEDLAVARLIPSRIKSANLLKANEVTVFPSKEEIAKGIRLRAHVASEGKATTETIFILALRQERLEPDANIEEAVFGLYDGQTANQKDLVQRIAAIPLKHRGEYLIRYAIRPKP